MTEEAPEQTRGSAPKRRSRFILLIGILGCIGVALFIWASFHPPRPGFVNRLNGQAIPSPWPMGTRLGNGITYFSGFPTAYFAFDGDPQNIKREILNELHRSDSPEPGYVSLPGEDGSVIHVYDAKAATMPAGASVVVVILGRKSWLQLQWDRIAAKF